MALDVVYTSPSSIAPWVFLTIGAVAGFVLVLLYLRRRRRPPQA